MLFGRCLRSPHASACIVSIDVRRAKALPGVHAVLTGGDVPDTRYGRMCKDIPLLAKGVTRFVGEKVAAVAADSVEIAEAALELMDVEYAELPAVFSPEDAMRPTAPVIHPEAVEILPGAATRSHGELSMYPPIPNVISQFKVRHGDVAHAFATAHKIFEHHFAVPSVHQGYIEPHTCLVSIGADGLVDVWVANKGLHIARAHMAAAIGVPEHRIRFNPVAIGGDFGGKGSLMDTLLCYHLARAAGRPVKMVMNSFEELTAGNPRHSASITLRTGVAPDARLLAIEARVIFNAGAYAGFVPVPTLHGGYAELAGTYRVPNCAIEVLRVYTNTVPCGHMRAPGAPQVAFAVESHIDMAAHEMGLDPLEMRLRNAIVNGDLTPLGETRRHLRCRETIEAGARAFGWDKPKPPDIGRGISIYEHPPGNFGRSTVTLTLDADGRFTLMLGSRYGHRLPYNRGAARRRAFRRFRRGGGNRARRYAVKRLRSRLQRPTADDDDRAGDRSRRRYDEAGSDGTRCGAAQLRAGRCPAGRGRIVFRRGCDDRLASAHGLGRGTRQGALELPGRERARPAERPHELCRPFRRSGRRARDRAGTPAPYRHRA
jgi:CO/xanthine dehydrogenase Mo-binding subunit